MHLKDIMIYVNGAKYMPDRTVIITGAGFSVPSGLPVQNGIITEIARPVTLDEFDFNESDKFLHAYIDIGLYLLENYSTEDISILRDAYRKLNSFYIFRKANNEYKFMYTDIGKILNQIDIVSNKHRIINTVNEIQSEKWIDEYFTGMSTLRGKVLQNLQKVNISVALEDIFTSFDKSLVLKEHSKSLTYNKLDHIRHSLLRLLIYYFSKIESEHEFKTSDYITTLDYIKRLDGVTFITINWDTIFESYLNKYNVEYDLCLNDVFYNDGKRRRKNNKIKFLKLHGSINWFKCLRCGHMIVERRKPYGPYLFDDKKDEKCFNCESIAKNNETLLQPQIITPTMLKSINDLVYMSLWKTASSALLNAQHIIFIGYSLPVADFEFRYMLQKFVPKTASIDVVLHKSDKPLQKYGKLNTLLPENRYREAFMCNDLNFFYSGFKKYFENIA